MPERRIVNAIVLRSVNYRDFDRILTLFSREEGKISAAARGAHRAKSPLAAASTQFTAGEFALEERNGKLSVKSFLLDEAFYPLREDARRLSYATALSQIVEEIVQPNQPNPDLYDAFLRALAYLAFDRERDCTNAVLPFLLRAMAFSGHAAMLTRCAACGGRIVDARWDSLAGGPGPARDHGGGHGGPARLRAGAVRPGAGRRAPPLPHRRGLRPRPARAGAGNRG